MFGAFCRFEGGCCPARMEDDERGEFGEVGDFPRLAFKSFVDPGRDDGAACIGVAAVTQIITPILFAQHSVV